VLPADHDVRAGDVWKGGTIPYQRYRAWQVAGQTAGLVGLGAVGRALRWRLEGLGMKVIAYDPYADDAKQTLDEVLEEADVISLHAAVTPETQGMIGAAQFEQMRDGVVFPTRPGHNSTTPTRWSPCFGRARWARRDWTISWANICRSSTR
jgi:D-3-phosphoglycerate dehydrogenase